MNQAALRVVVTGGATNIGRAISEAFLADGARVVVGQPDVTVAESFVRAHEERVIALRVDVADPGQCRSLINEAADRLGGLDILINNAAITGSNSARPLATIDSAFAEALWRVNVGGVLFCAQAAAVHLNQAGGGVIVNISSTNAFRPQRGSMVYAATKAAVASLTASMARELAPDAIRVVGVAPGDIVTDKTAHLAAPAAGGLHSDVLGQVPLGRGRPSDVAATVRFLCSEGARFVTGTTWLVDGGFLA